MMKFSQISVCSALVSLLLASCPAMAQTPRSDIVIDTVVNPGGLDPHMESSIACAVIGRNLHGNLLRRNGNGDILCELAESWSVSDDFTRYEFRLKDGLRFSDGSPLASDDVKFTLERALAGHVDYYKVMRSIEAPDPRTVIITLNASNSTFPSDLTTEYYGVYSRKALEGGMDPARLPSITSGAYYAESWEKGKNLSLKANPYYKDGSVAVKNALIRFSKQDRKRYEDFLAGKIDYIADVELSMISELDAHHDVNLISFDSITWHFMSLNNRHPVLSDKNIRKALHFGIDRDALIENVMEGYAVPADIPVEHGIGGYVDGYAPVYDLEKARHFLAASAHPDGFDLKVQCSDDLRVRLVKEMSRQLSQLGITLVPVPVASADARKNIYSGEYEGLMYSYSLSNYDVSHIAPMFDSESPMFFSRSRDGRIGRLLKKSISVSGRDRESVLREAYDAMNEEMPYLGLFWPTKYHAKRASLQLTEKGISEKFVIENMRPQ